MSIVQSWHSQRKKMCVTILLLLVSLSKEMLQVHKIHLEYIFLIGHELYHHKQQQLHLRHHLLLNMFIAHHRLPRALHTSTTQSSSETCEAEEIYPQYKQVTWAKSYNQYMVDLKLEPTLSNSLDPLLLVTFTH